MRCFFIQEHSRHEVQTQWGCFCLDDASYQDYLAGKLWISWSPSKPNPPKTMPRRNVSKQAMRLYDEAVAKGAYTVFTSTFPELQFSPYSKQMNEISIQEMTLSVRSSNCLMRAGIDTFGKLESAMSSEAGLMGIRNLGLKSRDEIRQVFFDFCYQILSGDDTAAFWQEALEKTNHESGRLL